MTQDGGQRIATADGAMLADPASLGNVTGFALDEQLFDPGFWAARGELADVTRGRGAAWFVSAPPGQWALRHYRRGGLIARFAADRYVWRDEASVRAFAEWRLLATLTRLRLPVPRPIAARYQRSGLMYRCDLLTLRIPGALPLSARLAQAALHEATWRDVGGAVARLHAAGVDHADLNAHNVLIDERGVVSVIDFDRGRLRSPPLQERGGEERIGRAADAAWAGRNIARLRRSLGKIALEMPSDRFGAREWRWLLEGYAAAPRL